MESSRAGPHSEPDQIIVSEKIASPPYTASLTACLSKVWAIAFLTRGSRMAEGVAISTRCWNAVERQELGQRITVPAFVGAHARCTSSDTCPTELSVAAWASPASRLAMTTLPSEMK